MLDYRVFLYFNTLAGVNPSVDRIIVFVATYLIWVVIAAILVWAAVQRERKNRMQIVGYSLVSFVLGRLVIGEIIRLLVHRSRPFVTHTVHQLIAHPGGDSFPSGHTMAVVSIGAGLYLHNKSAGLTVIILGIIIGLSRVFAGVHYPADILGGVMVGLLAGFFTKIIFNNQKLKTFITQ